MSVVPRIRIITTVITYIVYKGDRNFGKLQYRDDLQTLLLGWPDL